MPKGARYPTNRRRVVAIFLVAVMLPSLFLSYVGLKSIEQEKLWQQQLVEQNLRSSLALAVSRIESKVEDQSRAFLSSLPLEKSPFTSDFFSSVRTTVDQHKFIDQIFLLDKDLKLIYPRAFCDDANSFWRQKPKRDLKQNEYLTAGETLELRGSLEEAIKEYQKGIMSTTPLQKRLALMSRIARCQFKKNDLQGAEVTYQKIIVEDHQQFYGEEIPYALTAYHQLVRIAERTHSRISLPNLLLNFYQALLENFHRLEHWQYEFYLDEVKARLFERSIKFGPMESKRYAQLSELERQAQEERDSASFLQLKLLPTIEGELGLANATKKIRYSSAAVDGVEWHFGCQALEESRSPIRIIGFIVCIEALTAWAQEVCNQLRVGEGIRVELVKDGRDRMVGTSNAKVVLSTRFTTLVELLPGCAVGIVTSGVDPVEAVARKSMTIYYVLIFSIVAIIILGVVLIFRDISREEDLSRMKSEFISNVSHEIKTPIATVRTLAENLNEGWITDEEKRGEYFHLIARESERLSHLVENILDFSRIDARRKSYRMEVVPVTDVISKALDRFRLLVDGQGVKLSAQVSPDLPSARMDPEAIEQALLNLLDNAVKYSTEDKFVEVSADTQAGQLIVKVSDRGCGIDKKDLQKIFEKFYRVESSDSKKVVGSGIGLTLVKEIIEAHGGRVEVESGVGKGSVFTLTIPIEG